MKRIRRIVAMVLCVLMIINVIPVSTYANETLSETEMIEAGMNSAIAPETYESVNLYEDMMLMSTFSMNNLKTKQDVLLIKNKNPWDSRANEIVLNSLGIGYTTSTIDNAVELNFDEYKLIIVANDQVDGFYRKLSTIRTKLELFVMNGGTLLYGICDAGWGNGYSDLLIPGDIELGPVSYQNYNYIVDESHPIVSGILSNGEKLTNSNLYNNYASHRYFKKDSLPSDTNVIINAGNDKPTLIEYPIGNGIVIASAMTWEHSYNNSGLEYFGRKAFDDLLLYAYTVANVVAEINKNPGLGYEAYIKGLTCTAGDPVNVANGNFITSSEDLTYDGFISLNFSRYYNSLDAYEGNLGTNWRSNYNIYLEKLSERRLRLWHADGHSEEFIYGDDGIWYATPGTNSSIETVDSLVRITLENKTVYTFGEDLKLISLKAPYDNEICFEYDEFGNLIFAQQGSFCLKYIYKNNLLSEVLDKSGRTIKFKYENKDLISVENYDGKITSYEYVDGQMTKIHMNNEYTVTNTYDEFGRVVEQEMSNEGSCYFVYDDENYTTTYIDKNGATTVYYKDECGRIYKKEYADGCEILQFDDNNKLVKETDKLGNSTTYEYDERGNCISEIDALGNVISYEYDELNNKTAIIDAEGNRYEYTYDEDNYITSQSDAYGNFTFYTYDDKKQITKVVLPNNQELMFTYDEYGNVISTSDSDGNISYYTYNDMNQIVEEIDANGNIVKYEYSDYGRIQKKIYEDNTYCVSVYDDNDKLIKYTDELGNSQFYNYNTIGLLTSVIDYMGNITTYEYDCMNNVSKIINPDESYREYLYDINNDLIQIIDEEGHKTNYTYDANGNVIEEIDANGNVTYYSYDELNRIISITDARTNVITNRYSTNGNILAVTDQNGNSQLYEYNKNNQVIKFTNEAGEVETYEYDVMGRVISATDANENTIYYEYNGCGNITKIIKPDESYISITYDGMGNMSSFVEANGITTIYEYDSKGRLIKEYYADNTFKEYLYDAIGNQIGVIDENGNKTVYEYDCLSRLTKVIDAMGNETSYSYDNRGNLLTTTQYKQIQKSVIDSMKNNRGMIYSNEVEEVVVSYEYDKKNQLIKEISPMEKVTSYEYDAIGNMISRIDADGIVTNYTYDSVNNITNIQYGDNKIVAYEYSNTNYVVSMTDWNGTTTYELDPLGRVLSVLDYQNHQTEYEWNSNGEKSLIIYPDGSSISYEYDCNNRLIKVNDSIMGETIYEYDVNDNLIKTLLGNGSSTVNVYDSKSRLIMSTDYDSAGKIVDDYKYEYDNVGNKISINRDKKLRGIEKLSDESNGFTTYEYNSLNQLISKTNSKGISEKYFYDSLGNQIRQETWAYNKLFIGVNDYTYNSESQIIRAQGNAECVYGVSVIKPITMEYDDRGNLINISQGNIDIATYIYDETNALAESTDMIGLKTEYTYDGNGARLSKKTSLPDNIISLSSNIRKQLNTKLEDMCDITVNEIDDYVINYYVNDVTSDYNSVLFSYGNYSKTVRYSYGIEVLGAASCGYGLADWNELNAETITYADSCKIYYFLDEQGTPIKFTNKEGKVVGKYSYDEWGVPSFCTYVGQCIGNTSVIGYAGYQYDAETGLYYVQSRYYNPYIGNFVSKDAFHGILAEPLTLNRYLYCYGNPVMYVDPSGYYTPYEGWVAHTELQAYFTQYYLFSKNKAYVEHPVYGVESNKSFWGRADMVLDTGLKLEVYEIKPFADKMGGLGKLQLAGYINALNTYGIKDAVAGTSFIPIVNKLRLPYPPDPTRIITYYASVLEPGMIYYYISASKKRQPETSLVVAPEKEEVKVDTKEVCEGVATVVGASALAYVSYRVVRLLPSCTPWTFWTLPFNLATP